MIVTNLESVPGKKIVKHYGMVTGSTVRARNVFIDIWQWIKGIFGGELKGYSQLLTNVRDDSINRMVQQAEQLGANAVINVRFSTSTVTLGSAELYAYGTAVKVAAVPIKPVAAPKPEPVAEPQPVDEPAPETSDA